jgi:cytochrome c-type biogenesis protein CcmH
MIANSTWALFVVFALGFTVILAVIVIYPWLRRTTLSTPHANSIQLNIAIFKERLAELEEDYQRKVLEADEYLEQKIDLQRQLLAASGGNSTRARMTPSSTESLRISSPMSRWVVLMIFSGIPILCFSTYYFWTQNQQSQHRALLDFWANQDQYAEVADALMMGKVSQPPATASNHLFELLQSMQVNAYQHPLDAKRWVRLSEAYMDGNAIEPALAALAHAYRLKPENNDIAMTYAQMRFFSLQGKMDPVTQDIVARILVQDPEHEGALLLMSMATYQDQHYSEAIDWLQRLKRARLARATLSQPVNPAIIAQLDQTIHDAEIANAKLTQASSDHAVNIDVQVSDALKSKFHLRDTLFVYVRALQGLPAPYAVQKIPASVLLNATAQHQALMVTLSDANSMLPTRTISSAQLAGTPLVVAARVSQHSDPIGGQGDLESLPVPIDLGSAHGRRYVVNIDQIRP